MSTEHGTLGRHNAIARVVVSLAGIFSHVTGLCGRRYFKWGTMIDCDISPDLSLCFCVCGLHLVTEQNASHFCQVLFPCLLTWSWNLL
jgi:hypothetical protein